MLRASSSLVRDAVIPVHNYVIDDGLRKLEALDSSNKDDVSHYLLMLFCIIAVDSTKATLLQVSCSGHAFISVASFIFGGCSIAPRTPFQRREHGIFRGH